MLRRAALLALLILTPRPALAWDLQGHMAVAAIAYDSLVRSDPAAVRDIVAVMASHPDRARFDRNLSGLSGAARDRRMFEWMAQWPDDIRETKWDRPKWHYDLTVVSGLTEMPLTFGQAGEQYAAKLKIAHDRTAPPAERALALCWLFHIVGDMHQPLHAGHRMSWRFYFTDRAGTIAWTRRTAGGPPIELHQVWDQSLDYPGDGVVGAGKVAAEAETAVRRVQQGSFGTWSAESRALAVRYAYRDGAMQATRDPRDAPLLSPAYLADVRSVSVVRVGQAGLRLAAVLKGI